MKAYHCMLAEWLVLGKDAENKEVLTIRLAHTTNNKAMEIHVYLDPGNWQHLLNLVDDKREQLERQRDAMEKIRELQAKHQAEMVSLRHQLEV